MGVLSSMLEAVDVSVVARMRKFSIHPSQRVDGEANQHDATPRCTAPAPLFAAANARCSRTPTAQSIPAFVGVAKQEVGDETSIETEEFWAAIWTSAMPG